MSSPTKSLTNALSFRQSVENASKSSAGVYSIAINECTGPFPVPSHKTLTFRATAQSIKFMAEMFGSLSFSQRFTTCRATPISSASFDDEYPAAIIAAFNLLPNVGNSISPFNGYGNGNFSDFQGLEPESYKVAAMATRLVSLPTDKRLFTAGSSRLCRGFFQINERQGHRFHKSGGIFVSRVGNVAMRPNAEIRANEKATSPHGQPLSLTLIRSHANSFPFFTLKLRGNSTGKQR